MRVVLVLVLSLFVCQAPVPTFVIVEGFACRTPELWLELATAIDNSDSKIIRNIRLAQRCVDWPTGHVEVVSRTSDFLLIEGRAGRNLYIPRGYVIE